MTSRIIDRDKGYRGLFRRVAEAHTTVVVVGVQGEKERRGVGGPTNAQLATWHEFGTLDGHIPERSFIRSTINEHSDKYRALVRRVAAGILIGRFTERQALSLVGEQVASDIKSRIEAGIPPPNAESTVAQKGSSKPLIDTGQMRNAITYKIRASTLTGLAPERGDS